MKRKAFLLVLLMLGSLASGFAQSRGRRSPYSPAVQAFNAALDEATPTLVVADKPIIGITANAGGTDGVNPNYVNAVRDAGGVPFIISQNSSLDELRQMAAMLDGLIISGGEDVNPNYYAEERHEKLEGVNDKRDNTELEILKLATDRCVPVLGICRGFQLINVYFGGSLYQDIPSQMESSIAHRNNGPTKHPVRSLAGSTYASVVGANVPAVHSHHHQGVKTLAPSLTAVGWSEDGLVEAFEAYPNKPIMGVQYHPEASYNNGDKESLKLFQHLVAKACTFKKAKDIHSRILSVDTHTDTPMGFARGTTVGKRGANLVNIPKMDEGKLDGQFLAAFLSQRELTDSARAIAIEKTKSIVDDIYKEAAKYPESCGLAFCEEDLIRLKAEGKKGFFIGIENGYGIGRDLSLIKYFRDRGVRYMTLCHSYDNDICNSSTHSADTTLGLTKFGRKVVKELNKQGVLVDLSHASEGTFWDVMKYSKDPVICSHSSARALCNHDRNLTDRQLRALAQNGGVIQLCLLNSYINEDAAKASVADAVEHIDHIVKVAGIDHVGIGSDFDGGGGLIGCSADNEMINITVLLLEKGYTEEQLAKIWGGNFFRVMHQVCD